MDTQTITTLETVAQQRRMRFNPLRTLTPESLAMALDSFIYGDIRTAAMLWELIAERDDTIPGVKAKREMATAHRKWQVEQKDNSPEAKRQKEILEEFWHSARAVNAYDRNERGGMSRLVRQMMSAVSYKYAVHHIVWKPRAGMLSAEFEFVPLYFFENRTGRLRYCQNGNGIDGVELEEPNWMVTCGSGLMIACSILATYKRLANFDWLAFSEKFGMPGVLGRTSSAQDSEAGRAVAAAVESFCSEWSGVFYGDDGSGKIDLIEAKATANSLPFPVLIERADQKIVALYRGNDLGTFSRDNATGASVQQEETDILDVDDAAMISETLNEVERTVLEWWFGRGVQVRAGIKLMVPEQQDLKLLLDAIKLLVGLGAPIAVQDALKRFGFSVPEAGTPLLGAGGIAANARNERSDFMLAARQALAEASVMDREEMRNELSEILTLTNEQEQVERLTRFVAELPEQLGKDRRQVETWEQILASAIVNGFAD